MENIKNWVISNFELILTIIGFLITLIELRRTKTAVKASNKATEQTILLLSNRSTISDIGITLASLKEIQTALRGSRYEVALIRLQELRERLFALRSREGINSDENLQKIQEIVLSLKKMQDSIELYLSEPTKYTIPTPRFNNALAEHAGHISSWRDKLHYERRSAEE